MSFDCELACTRANTLRRQKKTVLCLHADEMAKIQDADISKTALGNNCRAAHCGSWLPSADETPPSDI